MTNEEIKVGAVIQATELAGEWCGCLLIVTDVKSWGVLAGMKVPYRGTTYIRLKSGHFEKIGEAVLIERGEETDD